MNEINKESLNLISENQQWLQEKFPSCFVEGKLDFKKLKQLVSEISDDGHEKYGFSWAGRSNSIKNIQVPSFGTLIPDKKESVNFDNTENIFIEGENLEVLKLLQKTYSSKVKMIYIDPPYNTGNDFIYKDDFTNSLESYLEQTGQSKYGITLTSNPESSGRFHSDWISFMYPRLFLMRNLMSDDGFVFISIDENEHSNLKILCDEIFYPENLILDFVWKKRKGGGNDSVFAAIDHEYILCYAKNKNIPKKWFIKYDEEYLTRYREKDEKGKFYWDTIQRPGLRNPITYELKTPDGGDILIKSQISKKTLETMIKNKDAKFMKTKDSWSIRRKIYLPEGKKPRSIIDDVATNSDGKNELRELFEGKDIFSNPKPTELIKYLMDIVLTGNDIVLDPFTGSGTTAQALFQLNKEDQKSRKFICVQIPEKCDDASLAKKEGFNTISEISKERIRRVVKKIKDENAQQKLDSKSNIGLGFKVFKLTKSNYKIWEDVKDETKLKEQLKLFEDPLIENYKDLDVLYEIIIKEGYSLNSKIEELQEKPNKIYKVSDDEFFFYVTLAKKLDEKSLQSLNLEQNTMFVCLDSALDDSQKTNLDKQCKLMTI